MGRKRRSKKRRAVVTTFNDKGYHEYAKKMIKSFDSFWHDSVTLIVYYEESKPDLSTTPRIIYRHLPTASKELTVFKEKHKDNPKAHGQWWSGKMHTNGKMFGMGFRWDVVRFCHKVFAVTHAGLKDKESYDEIYWLDADTLTYDHVPLSVFDKLLPDSEDVYCCFIGRPRRYPECGFLGFKTQHPVHEQFMTEFQEMYTKERLFDLEEWHDSYVFWEVQQRFEKRGTIFKNLNTYMNTGINAGHPFINTILGDYVDHLKGKRKTTGISWKGERKRENTTPAQENYWKNVKTSPVVPIRERNKKK